MIKKLAIFLLLTACVNKSTPYDDENWDDVFDDDEVNYCDVMLDEDCEYFPDYYYT